MQKITLTMTVDVPDDAVEKLIGAFVEKATPVTSGTVPVGGSGDAPFTPHPDETVQSGETEVDSAGVPYNKDVHALTKTKKADGTWTAQRGKADEAKKWADAHVAGADTETGEVPETEGQRDVGDTSNLEVPAFLKRDNTAPPMTGLPGATPPAATLPGTLPTAPEPITMPALMEKVNELGVKLGEGMTARITAMYGELGIDPNTVNTDESARRKLYDAINVELAK